MRIKRLMSGALMACAVVAPMMIGGGSASADPGDRALIQVQSGLALTAIDQNAGGQVIDGSRVQLKQFNQSDRAQKWIRVFPSSTGTVYQLRNAFRASSGELVPGCLDLPRDVARSQQLPGEKLVVRRCDSTSSQRWSKLGVQSTTNSPQFRLLNFLSAMSIDTTSNTQFANAVQQPDDGGVAVTSQAFREAVVN
jgi:hypothetical protein